MRPAMQSLTDEGVLEAKVVELAVRSYISPTMLKVSSEKSYDLGGHMLTMMLKALTVPYDSVSWPADWWQAFKARWFPGWLKRFSPVRFESRTFARYCPHIVPEPDSHAAFLRYSIPLVETSL